MYRRDLLKFSSLLLGGAVSGSVSNALAAAAPIHSGLGETIFNEGQQVSVALLSKMIIPATDTPGAIEAGVPDFIATIVSEWYNTDERGSFFRGLKSLDEYCLAVDGNAFNNASEDLRLEALRKQEQIAKESHADKDNQHSDVDQPFFDQIKELVVVGYYSSEIGAKQEWRYLPMPGQYDGDYDFSQVGRQWVS